MNAPQDPAEPTSRRAFLAGTAGMAAAAPFGPAVAALGARAADQHRIDRHRFGLNYVPSGDWYFSYNAWNRDQIAADLGRVAELGADHIRFMLVWPWFQPNPTALSNAHLDRLDQLIEAAAANGLDVMPSLYTGWLSGFHFNPNFYEDLPFYTSPKWARAQDLYVDGVAARLGRHRNLLGVDLGNELACSWKAPTRDGDAWMTRQLDRLTTLLPGGVHVNGVDHTSWFRDDTFSAAALIAHQPVATLHCWPFWTGAGKLGGPLDRPYTHLIAGMATLARSLGNAPRHPIWAQEFGACMLEMPERDVLRYLEIAVEQGMAAGVNWFTWWSSHDVSRRFDFHPFEYGLGLIDESGRIKPTGRLFRRIADRYRGRPVAMPPAPPPPPAQRTDAGTWRWLAEWMRYPLAPGALEQLNG